MLLPGDRDGIDVRGVCRKRDKAAGPARFVNKGLNKKPCPLRPLAGNDGIKGLTPFDGLLRIGVCGGVDLLLT